MCALLAVDQLSVTWRGVAYPANPVADGAAFELLADQPGPGWLGNPDGDPRHPLRRFVHASDIDAVQGPAPTPPDAPLMAPLRRSVTRDTMQRLSQRAESPGDRALLRAVHASAAIACGTRMLKTVRPEMVAEHLAGRALIRGFCYRHHDVAHLRSPEQLAALGVVEPTSDVCFALRWRAVSAADYAVAWQETQPGLPRMPVSQRIGPPVLGTGFAYSEDQLIPEYITADLADLPYPLHTEITAHLPDGSEVPLFRYLAEDMWAKVANRRAEHLLARLPGVDAAQQYHPIRVMPTSRLVAHSDGLEVPVVADPPTEFRVRSDNRAERRPVQTLARRAVRGASAAGDQFTVIAAEPGYLRVRACHPSPEVAFRHDLRCVERGVYETWLPASEVVDLRQEDTGYDVAALLGAAVG